MQTVIINSSSDTNVSKQPWCTAIYLTSEKFSENCSGRLSIALKAYQENCWACSLTLAVLYHDQVLTVTWRVRALWSLPLIMFSCTPTLAGLKQAFHKAILTWLIGVEPAKCMALIAVMSVIYCYIIWLHHPAELKQCVRFGPKESISVLIWSFKIMKLKVVNDAG